MHTRHQDKELYFREQDYTTRNYVIPFIEQHMKIDENTVVMEVGCGEGGNLVPFLDRGCQVTGVDISESKIDHALNFLGSHPRVDRLKLIADDIYNFEDSMAGSFDLIFLRDVIEHIHDQERFMKFIRKFLKKDGLIFFGFPPWYNPFGGHQQICENKFLSKLPYFHLLPVFLYKAILRWGGESDARIEALLEIKETGISIERFFGIVKRNDYRVVNQTHYLINPNYKIKLGLKPRKQFILIRRLPFFRNVLTTAVYCSVGNSE